ncbi:hypothetical protein PVAP13_5NG357400 [Panicum virgatum]|uniref:Uncharacterized protein n=1 Tax=Panicum virgatum TaxID=38727 RepID=A0A8T0RX57_PANVG|nr:hypothetical protein PVAP13_5NG357400 [Panicum virgatum]KAG2588960.1 hypothetical protein PVAP13_5NG357400 [Panicum virgatum]KAG2588961.1 hypothetical protein PVAP13_5NG357400 [Panicum virgatum]
MAVEPTVKARLLSGCLEKNPNKKKVRCKRCKGHGHFEKTYKLVEPKEDEAVETETKPQNKRTRQEDEGTSEAPQQKKKKKAPAKKAPAKKKDTPKKKKTPTKKKQKKN